MFSRIVLLGIFAVSVTSLSSTAHAWGHNSDEGCLDSPSPAYSNVKFDVVDITSPGIPLEVKGVLTQPVHWVRTKGRGGCFKLIENPPAIVILHGSAGMDNRNAFYGESLKRRFATLSVEMFGGVASGGSSRPELPLFNYSHAFGALNYLIETEGFIAEDGTVVNVAAGTDLLRKVKVDPEAVGCLGFSWGGVICNQVATELYSQQFGDFLYGTDYRFSAHVANYPVCYARNIPNPEEPTELLPGSRFGRKFGAELTGAPLLIQVGSEDAYDNAEGQSGSATCNLLKINLFPDEQDLVDVVVFEDGYHAFDRLFTVPAVVQDPFARLGEGIGKDPADWPEVPIIPDQVIANESLRNIFQFFRKNLPYQQLHP